MSNKALIIRFNPTKNTEFSTGNIMYSTKNMKYFDIVDVGHKVVVLWSKTKNERYYIIIQFIFNNNF